MSNYIKCKAILDSRTANFSTLSAANTIWSKVIHLAQKKEYSSKSIILINKDNATDFFYLAKGKLKILHNAKNGKERSMLYINAGSLFNEATALSGIDAPGCIMYCIEPSVVYHFQGKLLHDVDFIRSYPELIINLMESLSTKCMVMHTNLSQTTTEMALQRVCAFLDSLYKVHDEKAEFSPGMTQEECASLIGIHRATMVRVLHKLREIGILEKWTKNDIKISDAQKLSIFVNK